MELSTTMVETILVLGLAAGPAQVSAPPPATELAVEQARTAALELVAEDDLPALSVAVLVGGELVWAEAFGWADREAERRADTETSFRLGSVSKPLTSAALGILVEAGRIDLDAPIQDYVPDFPQKRGTLTCRNLAAHLSGLPHYEPVEFLNRTQYDSVTAAVAKFRDKELVHGPGEAFLYSSYGWNLLGAALEGGSGLGFLALMAERVFAPLELGRTLPDRWPGDDDNRAQPYARVGSSTFRAPAIDPSDAWPSAGFRSTASELVRFGHGMLAARLLRRETVALLWQEQQTAAGEKTGYGLGWQWIELAGHRAVGHGGSHVGATAGFWIVAQEELVLAVLTNTNSELLANLPARLVAIFLGPRVTSKSP